MNGKIIVGREPHEKDGRMYQNYFIRGNIRGVDVRVMVVPEKMDDLACHKLAREIKDKIEAELTYPGQIKVTVIREIRACELAK